MLFVIYFWQYQVINVTQMPVLSMRVYQMANNKKCLTLTNHLAIYIERESFNSYRYVCIYLGVTLIIIFSEFRIFGEIG